jgi:two-component system CheB/CheR fusion protein
MVGHAVEVARSGPEGIERAHAFVPEIVLCDIGLPEMDGYDVARAMRADPTLGRVTLVALTGYAGPDDIARAKAAGFDAHLAKPPTMATLERALQAR